MKEAEGEETTESPERGRERGPAALCLVITRPDVRSSVGNCFRSGCCDLVHHLSLLSTFCCQPPESDMGPPPCARITCYLVALTFAQVVTGQDTKTGRRVVICTLFEPHTGLSQ